MKSARFLCLAEQVEVAPDGLLDVILEHGDDQLVLAVEVRIERPAREAGTPPQWPRCWRRRCPVPRTRAPPPRTAFREVSSLVGLVRTLDIRRSLGENATRYNSVSSFLSVRTIGPAPKTTVRFSRYCARQPIEVTMNEHVQTASDAPLFNPLSPEFIRNPYPYYERLRATDPMHLTPLGMCRREPSCGGQPGDARQAFRQGLRRAHDAALRPEDHGRAGVPQHEPLDAAAGPARSHPPARPGGEGIHGAAGRGHAPAHPAGRRRDARLRSTRTARWT